MTRSKFYTNVYEDKMCYNRPPTRVVAGIRIGNTHYIELADGGHFSHRLGFLQVQDLEENVEDQVRHLRLGRQRTVHFSVSVHAMDRPHLPPQPPSPAGSSPRHEGVSPQIRSLDLVGGVLVWLGCRHPHPHGWGTPVACFARASPTTLHHFACAALQSQLRPSPYGGPMRTVESRRTKTVGRAPNRRRTQPPDARRPGSGARRAAAIALSRRRLMVDPPKTRSLFRIHPCPGHENLLHAVRLSITISLKPTQTAGRIGRCPLPRLTSLKATRRSNAAAHLPSSYLLQPLMQLGDLTMASFACQLGTARLGDGARLRFRYRPVPFSVVEVSSQPATLGHDSTSLRQRPLTSSVTVAHVINVIRLAGIPGIGTCLIRHWLRRQNVVRSNTLRLDAANLVGRQVARCRRCNPRQ